MSEGTESTHKVHIRKKRLLDSLNECPELNKCGLNQQDASDEPAFVLVSFDENEVKNTMIGNINKNVSVDNEMKTICKVAEYLHENFEIISCNSGNESCQELQADNAMQLTSHVKFELNTTKDAMENMMTTDTENFASFDNLPEADDNVAAYLKDNFQNISWNVDNKPRPKVKSNINKSDIENLKRYEHLENVKRIKMENLRKTVNATIQFLIFLEKLEQQEELQENQNIDNDESVDKKDFKMLVTENDNKNDIPQAHNQNEDVSKSPEYKEQHRMVAPYNDFNNFELKYNKNKNLPHCSKSPEEEINIMKNEFEIHTVQLEQPQIENISIATSTSDEHPPHMQIENRFEADANGMVCIGPNGTMIPIRTLESINWSLTGAAVTRKILVEIFGRETLAACNLTGKPSPAFVDCNKPVKSQLDPIIVADIIHLMGEQKGLTPKEVRNAITTKCADENKMLRMKEKKRQSIAERNMACGISNFSV